MARITRVPKVHFYLDHSSKDFPYVFFMFRYQNPLRANEKGRFIREDLKFAIGEKVPVKYWDTNLQMAKESIHFPEGKKINKKIADIRAAIQNIYYSHTHNGMPGAIGREDFKKELDYQMGFLVRPESEQKKIPTLFEFIERYIEQEKIKASAKRGTWKKYITVFGHLGEYAKERGIALDYENIDWEFRSKFVNWLYAPPRNHAINNASKILDTVRKFMREAHRLRYHTNLTFEEKGFTVKRVKVKNKVRLSLRELDALGELDLSENPRLDRARDLFIVGSYSGQRYSDWHKINRNSVYMDEDGEEMVKIMTQKNNKYVAIPLLPKLREVLEKYDYDLPKLPIQNFNNFIKEVFQLAFEDVRFTRIYSEGGKVIDENTELWRKASSHAARRSFVSNFLLLGVPAALIRQITGHSTERQLLEYADIGADELASQFAKEAKARLSEHYAKVKRIDKAS